jgi:hypothetical protein
VRISAWGEFMVGIGAMAAALLALNGAAGGWHPMLRFVLAGAVALAAVGVLRRLGDSEAD